MGPPVHLTGGTGHGMFVSVERRTHRHRRIRLPRRRFRGRSRLPTRITPNRKRHHPLLPRGTPARRHPRPGGTARRLRAPPARPDRWAKAPGRIRLGPTSFGCSTAVPTGPRTAHPGFRSFGLSEADHSGSLSGSRPMQQRLVCVEAGQTFSIQRMKVLTPQLSSIHCRLTRGRTLVRSQSAPPTVYLPQRPVLPFGHLAEHLIGDPADRVLRHRSCVHVLEVRRSHRWSNPLRSTTRRSRRSRSTGAVAS